MPRIPEDHMADVHIIRQDYAKALAAWQAAPSLENVRTLRGVEGRRERAIRMIHEEDGMSVRHLAAMFRTSKTTIREALEGGAD